MTGRVLVHSLESIVYCLELSTSRLSFPTHLDYPSFGRPQKQPGHDFWVWYANPIFRPPAGGLD